MKILLAASEVAPIIKIGGLGDVIGALPKALSDLGVDVDVIVPYFSTAKINDVLIYKSMEIYVPFNTDSYKVEVYKSKLPNSNVDIILLKNDAFFSKGGVNFYEKTPSEIEMFAFFSRAVVEYVKAGFNPYDIIHCNDWHTGLIPTMLNDELGFSRPSTLFTIHNLMYQGVSNLDILLQLGLIPGEHKTLDWDITDGDVNFMQQGIMTSDYISTVSESYVSETMTEEYGGVFSDLLFSRISRYIGILNGIDYSMFPRTYEPKNYKQGKLIKKQELLKKINMINVSDNSPIYGFVGRIDPNQKGIDILLDVIPEVLKINGKIVILGSGVVEWEKKLFDIVSKKEYQNCVYYSNKFDIDLANLIYSGSDFLLVPSKYEPCGLIQMISMWYGTLPIVHAVGGLKDTVINYHNGFTFDNYSSDDFCRAIMNSYRIYNDSNRFDDMINKAINEDFSWGKSALKYLDLYEKLKKIKDSKDSAHE